MVSVSKRHFKRAVKRNRVKRLVREAWRLQKEPLASLLSEQGKHLAVAFIFLAEELPDFTHVQQRMLTAVQRLGEYLKKDAYETTA